jgi:hypothetical protein
MKLIFTFLLFLFSSALIAQDEYEKKEPSTPLEPIYKSKDSIDVSEKEKKKEEKPDGDDASKAYTGMSDFKRNIRIGGAFNLGSFQYRNDFIPFDGQLFFVQISPQLTYIMSEHFEGGLTTSYSYTGSFGVINSHSISAGPILRAYPIPDIFLQVEGVGFYNSTSVKGFETDPRYDFNAFVGGGIVSRFSQTSYMITGVKINLMKNDLTFNQIIPTAFTSIHFGLW